MNTTKLRKLYHRQYKSANASGGLCSELSERSFLHQRCLSSLAGHVRPCLVLVAVEALPSFLVMALALVLMHDIGGWPYT